MGRVPVCRTNDAIAEAVAGLRRASTDPVALGHNVYDCIIAGLETKRRPRPDLETEIIMIEIFRSLQIVGSNGYVV